MRIVRLSFLVLLTCLCGANTMSAQVAEEHHYLFAFNGLETGRDEKILTELLRGFDQELIISVDHTGHLMKIKANRALDIPEVVALAAQVNVSLAPKNTSATREGNSAQSE
ncbi:MAG: hypothetical protein IPK99_15845 [Flavobacteriales bacterium]|nr:hypothetical protein [Flavobacteriales bacterium]